MHVHRDDRLGLLSLDGLMTIYGLPPAVDAVWRRDVVEKYHYAPRPDALAYDDGDGFDVGGATVRAIHLPGHTRGHSGFLIEPDGVMFLADIDLTGFGPYYGDAWSGVDEFERSIQRCREIDAGTYVTFHHKGVVHGRAEFLALLDTYEAVIGRREQAMLRFLEEPRTLDEMVAHRFVYRPHVTLLFAEAVERRSAELHLERLLRRGLITQPDPAQIRRFSCFVVVTRRRRYLRDRWRACSLIASTSASRRQRCPRLLRPPRRGSIDHPATTRLAEQ